MSKKTNNTKLTRKIRTELGLNNSYWITIKGSSKFTAHGENETLNLIDEIDWDWDSGKDPDLVSAIESLISAAFQKGRECERERLSDSLKPLVELFHPHL